jgi:hypothetical protein
MKKSVDLGLGLRKKARAILLLRRFKKLPKKTAQRTKTAQQTTQISGKTGFRLKAFWYIRGLGYNMLEDWVRSFFASVSSDHHHEARPSRCTVTLTLASQSKVVLTLSLAFVCCWQDIQLSAIEDVNFRGQGRSATLAIARSAANRRAAAALVTLFRELLFGALRHLHALFGALRHLHALCC